MNLEKFRKKKHRIWSSYEEEILVTNFNSGLKRENELVSVLHLPRHEKIQIKAECQNSSKPKTCPSG